MGCHVDKSHSTNLVSIMTSTLLVLDDNGKQLVSDSQRYKMLGNGWTIDVITHIMKNMEL